MDRYRAPGAVVEAKGGAYGSCTLWVDFVERTEKDEGEDVLGILVDAVGSYE